MPSLAVKYRPQNFESVLSQEYTIRILKHQLETNTFKNAYLFCGPSGDGKTTLARIFSSCINNGKGSPIEVDGASNNGVDNVRSLIFEASSRSLDSEYKTIIVDEAHMLTTAAWNAFLKCLEEPPKYTIFIFCTTDPQKIPATIMNRLMKFTLTRVPFEQVRDRLIYISKCEGFLNCEDACDYIAKLANGGVRDAISMLEKCASFSVDLSMNNVIKVLGNVSYDAMFDVTNAIIDGDRRSVIATMERLHMDGIETKTFVDQYIGFLLDLNKYCLFGDISYTKLPTTVLNPKHENDSRCVKYATGIENPCKVFSSLVTKVNDIKYKMKNDSNQHMTATIEIASLCDTQL